MSYTFWSWIRFTIDVGFVVTSISAVDSHGFLGFSFRRVVGAGIVRTGPPDLGDGDGRDGHEQHDS